MIVTKQMLDEKIEVSDKNSHAAYEVGEYYYAQGDYQNSIKYYKKAVSGSKPHSLALYALGYAYQNGEGVPVDIIQAFHYFEAAADKDVPQACYSLAYFYQNGLGVSYNQTKADYYSQRATDCLVKQSEELETLRSKLSIVQGSYEETLRNYEKECAHWEKISAEYADGKSKIAEYQSDIMGHKAEIDNLKNQNNQMFQENQNYLHTIEDLHSQIASLHLTVSEEKATSSELNGRLSSEKRAAEELIKQMNEKMVYTEKKHENATSEILDKASKMVKEAVGNENRYRGHAELLASQLETQRDLYAKLLKRKKVFKFFCFFFLSLSLAEGICLLLEYW